MTLLRYLLLGLGILGAVPTFPPSIMSWFTLGFLAFLGLTWFAWGLAEFKRVPRDRAIGPGLGDGAAVISRMPRLKNALLGLTLISTTASAGGITGNELLSWVNGTTYERLQAVYYMNGTVDGINMAGLALGKPVVCFPQGSNIGQITDVVIKEMKSSPETRHMEAQVLIMVTLRNTWPCK